MKKSSLIIVVIFFLYSCKVTTKDYLIIHSNNNNKIDILHYFHENNQEYARVYGNVKESDSVIFRKSNNDLLVQNYNFNEEQKRRIAIGDIKYINYYNSVTDIIYSPNPVGCINVLPIENLNFLQNDQQIEEIIKENCKSYKSNERKYSYNDCDFILPKSNNLEYLPSNSRIISVEVIRDKANRFQEINLEVKYFDAIIFYKRLYHYQDNRILKIKTIVRDSISTDTFLDSYLKINLK